MTSPKLPAMQIYMVGGAVRDALLGLPVKDRDWVVVGATPQQLVAQGYLPVGKDFPVFLHPRTREEYALARTERKTAPGYRGFAIHAAPDVTLEQDLARRDLTINAIAVDAAGVQSDGRVDPARATCIDPFNGRRDLQHKVLRHVGEAFREDPVRILRVARFAARFADFTVAAETMVLMRSMVAHGEAAALVAERVWQELARGLMETTPSRMFVVLRECAALAVLLPEVDRLWQARSNAGPAGPVGDCPGDHMLRMLDLAAPAQAALPVRFACLCLRLAPDAGAGAAGQPIAQLCQRLRVPTGCRALAEVAARECAAVHACAGLDAPALVRLLERCDAFRKPERFDQVLQVCQFDAHALPGAGAAPFAQRARLLAVLAAANAVSTQAVALRAQAAGMDGKQVGDSVHAARVAAVAALV